MKLVNLTPHTVNIHTANGEIVTVPSTGLARCGVRSEIVGYTDEGIELSTASFGDVSGLPEYDPDTMYIVSMVVRQALPYRLNIASPGELIRDANGNPIGCRGLTVNGLE